MAALLNIYLKEETLKTLLETVQKKNEKGVSITVSANDEIGNYEQNVSAYVSQTKEQQEQKVKRFYVGNGRVVWSKGELIVPPKQDNAQPTSSPMPTEESDDSPF